MSNLQAEVLGSREHKPNARPAVRIEGWDVYQAALARIRWLFDQFGGKVVVANSGGKDSTVVVELAAMVAAERGETPLHVLWLDQECEFQATVDYQRYLMYERDDIDFSWYQIPFMLENSTNHENQWLHVWDPEHPEDWVREKEPGSIHENPTAETHWYRLLSKVVGHDWPKWAILDGIRSAESPARRLTSESNPVYKWVTWSVRQDPSHTSGPKEQFRFHPVYDWSTTDVWKAIENHGWRYSAHYDNLYAYGVPTRKMRTSNYHHESALQSLLFLQEVEPETWEAATRRLQGISTFGHLGLDQYPKTLPYMFASWDEYAEYLIDNLPSHDEYREMFRKHWRRLRHECGEDVPAAKLAQIMVKTVIGNDTWGTHVENYLVSFHNKRKLKRLGVVQTPAAGSRKGSAV